MFTTNDDVVLQNVGVDAFMFLSYLKMTFRLFFILTLLMFVVLIPGRIVNHFFIVIKYCFLMLQKTKTKKVNYKANNLDLQYANVTDAEEIIQIASKTLNVFSIDNVEDGSNLLWIHLIGGYVVSALAYVFMYAEYRKYTIAISAILTEKTHLSDAESVALRTVVVSNLPKDLRDESKLKSWVNKLGIGHAEAVYMQTQTDTQRWDWFREREVVLRKLEKLHMHWALNLVKEVTPRPLIRRLFIWKRFTQTEIKDIHTMPLNIPSDVLTDELKKRTRPIKLVKSKSGIVRPEDAISFYENILNDLTEKIIWSRTQEVVASQAVELAERHSQTSLLGSISESTKQRWSVLKSLDPIANAHLYKKLKANTCTAFITFADTRAAFMARQLSLHRHMNPYTMRIESAPTPKNTNWDSLSLSLLHTVLLRGTIECISVSICVFWVIPTSFISSLSSKLEDLHSSAVFGHIVQTISQDSTLNLLVTTILPPLIIQICNSFMPYVFNWLLSYQGYTSVNRCQQDLLSKYFAFLLLNVNFVFTLFSNAWLTSSLFFLNPIAWIENISSTFPSGASFFINFLILNIILLPLELLRPIQLLFYSVSRLLVETPREFYELHLSTGSLKYALIYPPQILLFSIVMCYSIISPIVLLPGMLYFASAWLVYKNQLMFLYVNQIEDHGKMWLMAFRRSVVGLALFQFTTAGLLASKAAPISAVLCGALVLLTWLFYRFCEGSFERYTKFAPLESYIDDNEENTGPTVSETTNKVTVKEPTLKVNTKRQDSVRFTNVERIPSPLASASATPRSSNGNIPVFVRPLASSKKKMFSSDIGLNMISPGGSITSPQEHRKQVELVSYSSPALSAPLEDPWIPAFLQEIKKRKGGVTESSL